ncbi:UDP-glucose 4-epimerase GalE [Methanothermobacter tenebrarum]|uniref:UDP-glucose 4-epimerase GalE n=1 Tax=Methanothermobacter tenebrarum TaxID=680118 RepID=A0A328P8D8_9EURY|nr:UDP-glucose 4-epimerase GalE [Methanothermobacter tenebrarum]NPV64796.1 UDP-glucose 4-epimerase GalE [Methanobacteriaceae archaeon]RAO78637.1 UDP-glucose 4-epimerase GalE [Methanothermobacter tenebrarum]
MIFIVGGAGYIGSHVNKFLSKKGYKTLILDNLSKGHEEFVKWGEFIKGDLKDKRLLDKIFKEYNITTVMHFAALTDVRESIKDPGSYYRNNVKNTLNLLDAMQKNNINRFIFSSTCAVYGDPIETPITEDHPCNPISPYGRSKLMIEKILEDYSNAYDFNYVSLRYFNAAGADPQTEIGEWHEPETHLIPIILDVAIGKRENVQIFGTDYPTPNGTCIRDYIHVMDLADAHYKALKLLEEDKSEIFNLGNGDGFSVKEIIETCREVTGEEIPTIESDRRPGDPPILIGSSKKAKRILRWEPEFSDIKDIIETAWEWHQKLNNEII